VYLQSLRTVRLVSEANTYTCSNPASISFQGGLLPANKPPIAAFTQSCSQLDCNFVDGSLDLDGTLKTWMWSFGDGSSSAEQNPSHSYDQEGSYDVTLSVTDDEGATGTLTQQVTVPAPGPATGGP
jgi:PKD repeat protein